MKEIYLITGDDEWLTNALINRLIPNYNVTLIKLKPRTFDFIKKLKIIILIGFIDFFKILNIQYRKKKYRIIELEKKNLNNYLKKIKKKNIFLLNCPFKITCNLKNIYNCHPSLLPNYKGLLPIQRNLFDQLFNKKKNNFGLTIHKLNKNFDSGKIIWNKSINLNSKQNLNFKKIYERFYENFYDGIVSISSSKKFKCIKIKKNMSHKSSISLYEILMLKIKIL